MYDQKLVELHKQINSDFVFSDFRVTHFLLFSLLGQEISVPI